MKRPIPPFPTEYRFAWKEYLRTTVLGQTPLGASGVVTPLVLTARTAFSEEGPAGGGLYMPASYSNTKDVWLEFQPRLDYDPPSNSTVVFTVENHGSESESANDPGHEVTYDVSSGAQLSSIRHRRRTAYRGLHYMIAEFRVNGETRRRTCFGVWIQ